MNTTTKTYDTSLASESEAGSQKPSASESAARLDRLPIGWFHFRVIAIISAGLFVESFELFIQGSVLAALKDSGWTTLEMSSFFVSATFLGLMLGGWFAGIVGDHLGRKKGYQINLLIFGGGALAAFFAPNMETLIALRFIMGIGLGAEIVLGYSTLSEFVPAKTRGRLVAFMSVLTHSGMTAASITAAWVIPNFGWRYMFLIAALGAAIVWFFRRNMPESPRWLESKGRIEEARVILHEIERVAYKGKERPAAPIIVSEVAEQTAKPVPTKVWELFSKKYIRSTLVGFVVMVTMQVCLYGLLTWLPTFFVSQGHTMAEALRWSAIVTAGQPIGGIILIFIVDKIDRKKLLSGASILAVAFSSIYITSAEPPVYMLLATGFVFMMLTQLLMTVGQAIYLAEIFPTKLRSRGVGMVSSASRLLQVAVQVGIPVVFATYKVAGIMIVVDIVLILFVVILLKYGPETRNRTLEEISN